MKQTNQHYLDLKCSPSTKKFYTATVSVSPPAVGAVYLAKLRVHAWLVLDSNTPGLDWILLANEIA